MSSVSALPQRDPSHNHLPVSAPGGHDLTVYNPYLQQHLPEDEIDLRQLWRTISKYRWTIISVVLISVLTTLIASVLIQPVYRSSVLIEVQPSQRAVKFENLQQLDTWDPELLMTQTNILLSESVAEAVVADMNLAERPGVQRRVQAARIGRGYQARSPTGSNPRLKADRGMFGDPVIARTRRRPRTCSRSRRKF